MQSGSRHPRTARPRVHPLRNRVELPRAGKAALAALALGVLAMPQAAAPATLNELTYFQIVTNVPINRQIEAARRLGVRGVRLAVRWNEIEKVRGQFNWLVADGRIRAVKDAGLTPLIVIFGGNSAYPPAEGVTGSTPSSEEGFNGYANFAAEAAKRYGAGTPEAPIYYEIWNEPNTKTFWGRNPEPETYAEMARRACEAIKQAAPSAKVLALAMEGTPVKSPYFVKAYGLDIYQEWARRAATPALMACADGFSMHPYLNQPEQHYTYEPALQTFLAAHWSKPAPPVVAHTEWGYQINLANGRTAQDQAALDLRALLIGTAPGRLTNLYQSVDTGIDPAKPDETYGFVTYLGETKPNGAALKRLLDAIGDYQIGGLEVSAAPRVYRFNASRGNARAQVIWTTDAPTTVAVEAGGQAVDLVTGAARPLDGDQLPVDAVPVLVTWGG